MTFWYLTLIAFKPRYLFTLHHNIPSASFRSLCYITTFDLVYADNEENLWLWPKIVTQVLIEPQNIPWPYIYSFFINQNIFTLHGNPKLFHSCRDYHGPSLVSHSQLEHSWVYHVCSSFSIFFSNFHGPSSSLPSVEHYLPIHHFELLLSSDP